MMVSGIRELIELREKHCLVRADAAAAIGIREQMLYILENNNNQPSQPLLCILNFRNTSISIFPEVQEFLVMLYGFELSAFLLQNLTEQLPHLT